MKRLFFLYTVLMCFCFSYVGAETVVTSDQNSTYFVVLIASYNNSQWYQKNISSALNQDYDNYEIVYVNDCSTDGTGQLVQEFLDQHSLDVKVTLINNQQRYGALHNVYNTVHKFPDHAVVVILDGDDWLFDNQVLSKLNTIYAYQNVWLTYGQFVYSSNGKKGWCVPMPDEVVRGNAFRQFPHFPSHLRTFYAWLFKKINIEDLLYKGDFFTMTYDQAVMFPMIEMAGDRHKFIDEPMYVYNTQNPISDHLVDKKLQSDLATIIRAQKPYARLDSAPKKVKE